jgi:hypothetical protein
MDDDFIKIVEVAAGSMFKREIEYAIDLRKRGWRPSMDFKCDAYCICREYETPHMIFVLNHPCTKFHYASKKIQKFWRQQYNQKRIVEIDRVLGEMVNMPREITNLIGTY